MWPCLLSLSLWPLSMWLIRNPYPEKQNCNFLPSAFLYYYFLIRLIGMIYSLVTKAANTLSQALWFLTRHANHYAPEIILTGLILHQMKAHGFQASNANHNTTNIMMVTHCICFLLIKITNQYNLSILKRHL